MRFTRPLVKQKENENPWVTYLKAKVEQGNDCVDCAVVGERGKGKSWAVLSMCHMIDPDFTIDGNWFFKAAPFMRAIDNYYNKNPNPKLGKIWVLDEAGVDLNNLNFMDELNKGLNIFFQTARHRNYYFFGTVPYLSFISKGVRSLMTTKFTVTGYNTDNQTVIYPRIMQYNDHVNKTYHKLLAVRELDGSIKKCEKIRIPRPPIKLVREYEREKKKFTGNLMEGVANRLENWEKKQVEKYSPKTLKDDEEEFLSLLKKGMNLEQVQEHIGYTRSTCYNRINKFRSVGIGVIPVKKEGKIARFNIFDNREELMQGL